MHQLPVETHQHNDCEHFVSRLEILGALVAGLVLMIETR
jgi:hypothetical protein